MRARRFSVALALGVVGLGCGSSSGSDNPGSGTVGGAPTAGGAAVAGSSGNSTRGGSGGVGGTSTLPGGTGPGASGNGQGGGVSGTSGAASSTAGSAAANGGAPSNAGTSGNPGGTTSTGGAGGTTSTAGATTMGGSTTNGGAAGAVTAGRAGSGGRGPDSGGTGGSAGGTRACGPVTPVPEEVRTRLNLDAFYRKHVDANGLSVLSSDAPADESLIRACELLLNMLSKRDDVRQELIRRKARFAIIGKDEGTADIPEYGYRNRPQADIDQINQRARGLASIVASCGEENILCLNGDRYFNESICVHEFAHTISLYGAYTVDDSFEEDLEAAFDSALASRILDRTYRNSNLQEYWAEGVQDWYNTNASSNPPNGVHNQVNTRTELASFDPTLHALIATLFPNETEWGDCHID